MRIHAALLAAVLVLGAAPPRAQAAEGENTLSLFLGYGTLARADQQPSGGVLGLDFERGFSDALAWRLSGGLGTYPGTPLTYSGHLTAGLTYLFDVLKYVPYANLGVGAIAIGGGDLDPEVSALLELGAGLDVLHSRSFSYGVQLRFESFLEQTSFFTVGVRASWRWGFF